jgi:hypothetical protein
VLTLPPGFPGKGSNEGKSWAATGNEAKSSSFMQSLGYAQARR